MPNKDDRVISVNRKAYHDYTIIETVEAGIVLKGSEIKSIRAGQVQLRDSYARPDKGELWLYNSHVSQYAAASYMGHEPERARKLLLHRKQMRMLAGRLVQKGLTLVPLKLYIKRGRAKLELGLAEGKRQYDKREVIARRDADREIDRAMKSRYK
jgi:SsrA-binding protein